MDQRLLLLCLADIAMVIPAAIYGVQFMKKGNYLLGLEWLVMATSGSNFLLYFLTGSQTVYNISYFFDAFSRAFGFPVIAVAGLLVVTDNYKPSALADVAYFALSALGAAILVGVDIVMPIKPYFYLVMSTLLSIGLAYFAWRLLRVGQAFHAVLVSFVLISVQVIAYMDDFYKIPGDATNLVLNFYLLALLTWAFMLFELYYAYCAMERVKE